jgi:predicted transcriptional regulator
MKQYQVDEDERRSKSMTFRIKPSYRVKLEKLCKNEERSITYMIERALTDYFKAKHI